MQADIAVLIPVYNAPLELLESLESLATQDVAFVVFLVDDGSAPAVSMEQQFGFPIELIRLDSNRGITAALNIGLEEILRRGFPFIARLDAGDLVMQDRFCRQRAFLKAHPDHALVSTGYEVFDDAGRTLFQVTPPRDDREIRKALYYRNPILHPGIMFNASFFSGGVRYDERIRVGQDYEIIRRLAAVGKIANLPDVLMRYRFAANSITSKRNFRYFGRMRIQLRYFDVLNMNSYLGLLRSMVLCLVPFGLYYRVRAWLKRLRSN